MVIPVIVRREGTIIVIVAIDNPCTILIAVVLLMGHVTRDIDLVTDRIPIIAIDQIIGITTTGIDQ